MKIILDTHVFLWLIAGDSRLSARRCISLALMHPTLLTYNLPAIVPI